MKKIAETVSGLVESVEKLQNRNETEKFHHRDRREYNSFTLGIGENIIM